MLRNDALITGTLALAICGTAGWSQDKEPAAVTGNVRYLQRSALPPDALIHVQLQDVSLQDAKAKVIGETRIPSQGKQVPIAFRVSYSPSDIDKTHSYAVRATIIQGGRLIFTSTTSYPVITRGAPTDVSIMVQPVAATPPGGATKLEGTDWRLTSLGGTAVPGTSKAALMFNANGMKLSGSSGCNRLVGGYKLSGSSLHFEPAGLTRMACPEPLMKLENAFMEALRATTSYRIAGKKLDLLAGTRTLASFEAGTVLPDKWLGKWIGPEGTTLELSKKGDKYSVQIRSLDGVQAFEGVADGDRILFTRAGKPESIHAGSGQETGMKWLLDKKNCLIVQTGEGFCRP